MKYLFSLLALIWLVPIQGESFYEFSIPDITGKTFSFSNLKGHPVLVVNVASGCGYTYQYKDLESLYQKYKSKGLKIVAIPSNDFGGQEPLSNPDIAKFCKLNYNVSFDLLSKQPATGKSKHPLFQFLIKNSGDAKEIGWNFEKFLVDKTGKVTARFPSATEPGSTELLKKLEGLL